MSDNFLSDLLSAYIKKLEAVAAAAKEFKAKQDEWGQIGKTVPGHYESWLKLGELLTKLEAKDD